MRFSILTACLWVVTLISASPLPAPVAVRQVSEEFEVDIHQRDLLSTILNIGESLLEDINFNGIAGWVNNILTENDHVKYLDDLLIGVKDTGLVPDLAVFIISNNFTRHIAGEIIVDTLKVGQNLNLTDLWIALDQSDLAYDLIASTLEDPATFPSVLAIIKKLIASGQISLSEILDGLPNIVGGLLGGSGSSPATTTAIASYGNSTFGTPTAAPTSSSTTTGSSGGILGWVGGLFGDIFGSGSKTTATSATATATATGSYATATAATTTKSSGGILGWVGGIVDDIFGGGKTSTSAAATAAATATATGLSPTTTAAATTTKSSGGILGWVGGIVGDIFGGSKTTTTPSATASPSSSYVPALTTGQDAASTSVNLDQLLSAISGDGSAVNTAAATGNLQGVLPSTATDSPAANALGAKRQYTDEELDDLIKRELVKRDNIEALLQTIFESVDRSGLLNATIHTLLTNENFQDATVILLNGFFKDLLHGDVTIQIAPLLPTLKTLIASGLIQHVLEKALADSTLKSAIISDIQSLFTSGNAKIVDILPDHIKQAVFEDGSSSVDAGQIFSLIEDGVTGAWGALETLLATKTGEISSALAEIKTGELSAAFAALETGELSSVLAAIETSSPEASTLSSTTVGISSSSSSSNTATSSGSSNGSGSIKSTDSLLLQFIMAAGFSAMIFI